MTDTSPDAGTYERPEDKGADERALWKLWMAAIELSTEDEKDWRTNAEAADKLYAAETAKQGTDKTQYHILYTNTQTKVPALYNSTPEPDVRRRFGDNDPIGKVVSQIVERCVSVTVDQQDFDSLMYAAVTDAEVPGRGLTRVRYVPTMSGEQVAAQRIEYEHVAWDDFRRGPAKRWEKTPWIAFRHYMTRQQLEALDPKIGAVVKLESSIKGADDKYKQDGTTGQPPDLFKRACVWEIWDREGRQTIWLAESWKDGPIRVDADLYEIEGFFPVPRPLYGVERPTSLVPVTPYELYRQQAEELDSLTRRLGRLIKALRWRGVGHKAVANALEKMKDLEDGQIAPTDDEVTFSEQGIDKMVWVMPIDQLTETVVQLYEAREQCKKTIFEITGVADILRGATDPRETLGAQKIKAQWGSLRLNRQQMEVARYARDIFRMTAELIANKFAPQQIMMMSGLKLPTQQEKDAAQALVEAAQAGDPQAQQMAAQAPPEQVEYLKQPTAEEVLPVLKRDLLREYRIDIETDSTVRADTERQQANIGQFVQGLGAFAQAVAPAVEAGAMPKDVMVDLLSGFSRVFKLGKQAEDALDRWSEQAKREASQPPPPDPAAEAERVKADAEKARAAQEMEKGKMDAAYAAQEHDFKMKEMMAKHEAEMAKIKAQRETMMLEAMLPQPALANPQGQA